MATKKKSSQAERAASGAKKQTKPQTTGKSGEKGKTPEKERSIPVRFYSATACICTFLLLLIIFFTTEGAIPGMIRNLIYGMKLLHGTRVLLRDGSDNRYEIPDLRQLDAKSRHLLDNYI